MRSDEFALQLVYRIMVKANELRKKWPGGIKPTDMNPYKQFDRGRLEQLCELLQDIREIADV